MNNLARWTVLVVALQVYSAWGAIVYTSSPAFSIPNYFKSTPLDINQDGTPDVIFVGDWHNFDVSGAKDSELLESGDNVQILSAGDVIGASPDWSAASTLLAVNTSSGWLGPLGVEGQGYLGIQFMASDGLHYGWVQARLPQANEFAFAPVVVDWAYESEPDKPIVAGARPVFFQAGCINEAIKFPLPARVVGTGTFSLETNAEGGTLSYYVQVQWMYKPLGGMIDAELNTGKAVLKRPIVSLGEYSLTNAMIEISAAGGGVPPGPLPAPITVTFAVYQGDVKLTGAEVRDLMRGRCYLSLEYVQAGPHSTRRVANGQIRPVKPF